MKEALDSGSMNIKQPKPIKQVIIGLPKKKKSSKKKKK